MWIVWFVEWLISSRENIWSDEKSIFRADTLITQNCNNVWILITESLLHEKDLLTILTKNLVYNEVISKWIFRQTLWMRHKNNWNNRRYFYINLFLRLSKLKYCYYLVKSADYFISKLFVAWRDETKSQVSLKTKG